MLSVPNKTESPRKYARRQLCDLAYILDNLHAENWDNPEDRQAIIRGLQTHSKVLLDIAEAINELPVGVL